MNTPDNAFVFAPMFNQPPDTANPHGNDATGAFQPGASQFSDWCDANSQACTTNRLLFNNLANDRAVFDQILHQLAISPWQLDCVAYFGHGIKDMMVSAKIGKGYFDEFVQSLRANCGSNATIILYACSCGMADGFASKLADALRDMSITVYGHASAGHAYMNPMLRRFPGCEIVCPSGMVTPWLKAFNDPKSDLWIRAPFMTDDELKAELGG